MKKHSDQCQTLDIHKILSKLPGSQGATSQMESSFNSKNVKYQKMSSAASVDIKKQPMEIQNLLNESMDSEAS
jgi:hypothetical protein